MKYRRLGKTELRVSAIGLGTWQYSGDWGKTITEEEVCALFARARELGFNLVDTAAGYGDHLAERFLGKALAGQRDQWVIVSKFGREFWPIGRQHVDCRPKSVLRQLEDSLRALRTDCIDVYLMHSMENEIASNDAVWTVLDKARSAGKIKHLGISLPPRDKDNIYQTELALQYGCDVIECVYNRLDRQAEDGVFYKAMDNDLGVLARVPMAQGYLSGKYRPGSVFTDVRAGYYDADTNYDRLSRAVEIIRHEVPQGVAPSEWAMAWSVSHPAVAACIPGFKTIAQLEGGARAAALLTDDHPLSVK